MFALKKPCVDCPFRKENGAQFGLCPGRIQEIVNAPAFECHLTGRNTGGRVPAQQCAGLMAMLHKEGKPNDIMQVAERITDWKAANLDGSAVYGSIAEATEDHSSNDLELD